MTRQKEFTQKTHSEEIREDEEAREKHRSDWIKAEYETMGWDKELKPVDVAVEPLVEKDISK